MTLMSHFSLQVIRPNTNPKLQCGIGKIDLISAKNPENVRTLKQPRLCMPYKVYYNMDVSFGFAIFESRRGSG